MVKDILSVILISLLSGAPVYAANPVFPGSGMDARSLERGGTVIAETGGAMVVLGDSATLKPYGSFYNGTLNGAILWDPDPEVMKRLVFALTVGFQ